MVQQFGATITNNETSAHMIILKFSSELWRFVLLICILVFHKSVYKLVARIMDCVTSISPRSTSSAHFKQSGSSDPSSSPRKSSFHRRFRSSTSNSSPENASPTDTIGSPLPPTRSEAVGSAKRFLLSTIRDDWDYTSPGSQSAHEASYREPLDYRVREDGSSGPEPLSDEPYDVRDPMVFTNSDPYKFENPDAIARTVGERKRKRQKMFRKSSNGMMG